MRRETGIVARMLVLAGILTSGCAQIPKDAGFEDVKQLAAEHQPYHLQWNRGTTETAEVSRMVSALLREELSVDGAVQIALLNNASLQAVYERLGITQADVVQAGLLENPVLFGSARFPDRPPSGMNLEFEVTQNFLNLLMLPARKRLAAAQFTQAKLQTAEAVLSMAARVRRAYYQALGAKQVLQMRRLVAHTLEASYKLAQRLYRAGNISELDFASEQNQYEQARVALVRSQAEVLAKREDLNRLLGLWGHQTDWKLPERLPDLPLEEHPLEHLESVAIANRLDIAEARQEVLVFALAYDITRNWRWIGSAEVGVNSERDTDGQWMTGPFLSLQMPIFDQRQAEMARAAARLRRSQQKMTDLAVTIRSEVRTLRDRLIVQRHIVGHYKEVIIPLREQIVSLTQRKYNYMLAGVFELLIAKQREFDAYQEYLEMIRDYWISRVDLQKAVGGSYPSNGTGLSSQKDPQPLPGPKAHPGPPSENPSHREPQTQSGDHHSH